MHSCLSDADSILGPRGTTARRESDLKNHFCGWVCIHRTYDPLPPDAYSYKVPRRPFESARLDAELKVCSENVIYESYPNPHQLAGEYGLRNKREIWRIALILSKIRRAARELLKLDDKDPKRLFEGNALIRRLVRIGVLDETRMRLDYVLALKIEDFLERRLQTQVFKSGLAKSIHHARVLIRQRHIRCVNLELVLLPFPNSSPLVLASRSSTSLPSSFVSTPKSTSTSLSPRPMVVDAPVVLSASVPPLLPRGKPAMMRMRSKCNAPFSHQDCDLAVWYIRSTCPCNMYDNATCINPCPSLSAHSQCLHLVRSCLWLRLHRDW